MPEANPSQVLLPLSEVVQDLRSQIAGAEVRAQKEALRFKLNSVEIELTVVARRELGGDAKVKFSVLGWGVEAGTAGKIAQEQTHKIKLSMTPSRAGAAEQSWRLKGGDQGEVEISRKSLRNKK